MVVNIRGSQPKDSDRKTWSKLKICERVDVEPELFRNFNRGHLWVSIVMVSQKYGWFMTGKSQSKMDDLGLPPF